MTLIALTGGIASGKSTIGHRLNEHGAVVIDADALARQAVVSGSQGLNEIVQRFGQGVLSADGSLDRGALAAIVFTDPEALAALNAIVHPAVRRLFHELHAAALAQNPDAIIVYEIPLLAEAAPADEWDCVIVADAPAAARRERMIKLRGMTAADAERRLANQADDATRRALADVIIDTSGTREQTLAQVDEFWESLAGVPDRPQD